MPYHKLGHFDPVLMGGSMACSRLRGHPTPYPVCDLPSRGVPRPRAAPSSHYGKNPEEKKLALFSEYGGKSDRYGVQSIALPVAQCGGVRYVGGGALCRTYFERRLPACTQCSMVAGNARRVTFLPKGAWPSFHPFARQEVAARCPTASHGGSWAPGRRNVGGFRLASPRARPFADWK